MFKPLMAPHLTKVEAAIEPGLTMLNWTSLNLDTYVDGVYETLAELELLIDRANDLMQFRIDAVLDQMTKTTLCELPKDCPWTTEDFLKNTEVNECAEFYELDRKTDYEQPRVRVGH